MGRALRLATMGVPVGGGGATYLSKVLGTQPSNLVGYWPLNEVSGTTVVDAGTNGLNGTYGGNVVLGQNVNPDGKACPYFDGTVAYGNLYSVALAALFDGNEGSFMVWLKPLNAAVWSDTATRRILQFANTDLSVGASVFSGGGGTSTLTRFGSTVQDPAPGSDWICYIITWSRTADKFMAYKNGAQLGPTQTGLGNWVAALASNRTAFSTNNVPAGTQNWKGWLCDIALWDTAISASQAAALASR